MYSKDFPMNLAKQDATPNLTTHDRVELVFNFDIATSAEERSSLAMKLADFLDENGWTHENGFFLEPPKCEEGSTIVTIVVFALRGVATGVLGAIGALFFRFLRKKVKSGSLGVLGATGALFFRFLRKKVKSGSLASNRSQGSGLAPKEDIAMIEKSERQYGEIYGLNQLPIGLDLPFPDEFFAAPKVVIEQKVTLLTPEGVTKQYTRKVEVIEGKIKRNTISQDEYFE
jgi:hypothetical protein